MKKNPTEIANEIKETCKRLGWTFTVRNGSVLTIDKKFQGKEGFVECDTEYYSILSLLPSTSAGSIWGTEGGGIGALAAMNSGVFTMNKSGGSKRVLKALTKGT